MRGRIEERAKNVRSCELELPPKRSLWPALPVGNRCEHQQDSAVRKIGTSNDILDPVENDGSGGGKQNFVLIGEQPTGRKSTATRQTAEGHSAPHLSFLLVRLGGFAADYFRGNPSTLRAARLSGARCSGFREADARLITIGELDAGRLECML